MKGKQIPQHKKVYIKKSNIHGNGIFAKKDIKRGECVSLIKGKIVHHIVVDKKTSWAGPNWIGIDRHKWIVPDIFSHINHSCDPNTGIKGSRTLVAFKNIRKNEEILIDYSTTEEDILWALSRKCRCGSKKCRKVIKSIQFLPKNTFNKYLPYIPEYFQKVYIKHLRIHGK